MGGFSLVRMKRSDGLAIRSSAIPARFRPIATIRSLRSVYAPDLREDSRIRILAERLQRRLPVLPQYLSVRVGKARRQEMSQHNAIGNQRKNCSMDVLAFALSLFPMPAEIPKHKINLRVRLIGASLLHSLQVVCCDKLAQHKGLGIGNRFDFRELVSRQMTLADPVYDKPPCEAFGQHCADNARAFIHSWAGMCVWHDLRRLGME